MTEPVRGRDLAILVEVEMGASAEDLVRMMNAKGLIPPMTVEEVKEVTRRLVRRFNVVH